MVYAWDGQEEKLTHHVDSGYHLELMNAKGRASMAARICVKLHGKKLLELSRLGLYHLVSACLVVVLATDASDMVRFALTRTSFL